MERPALAARSILANRVITIFETVPFIVFLTCNLSAVFGAMIDPGLRR
jgi:hypothetical protein